MTRYLATILYFITAFTFLTVCSIQGLDSIASTSQARAAETSSKEESEAQTALYVYTTKNIAIHKGPIEQLGITLPGASSSAKVALITMNLPDIVTTNHAYATFYFVNRTGSQLGPAVAACAVRTDIAVPYCPITLTTKVALKHGQTQTIYPAATISSGSLSLGSFANVSASLFPSLGF